MKNIINPIFSLSFIALLLTITGCKNTSEKSETNSLKKITKSDSTMEQTKLQSFGKNYAEAWSSQKSESVASFFASNGSLSVNEDTPAIGKQAITKVAEGFMTAFPDMKVSMDSLVTKSNRTEFHWTLTGTNSGSNGTGNKVRFSGVELWQFNKDGLIQESKGSFDAEEYNRQLERGIDN